jgi:hypothetical protein
MAKLRTEFGPKAFTPERQDIIARAVRTLPDRNFEKIVQHFIANFRQAPLPRDFLEAAAKERVHLGEIKREWVPAPEPDCDWCNDGGVMEVEARQSGREYFIRCGCLAGHKSFRTDLPIWSTETFGEYFKVHKMKGARALRWKSKNAFDPKAAIESLNDKVEEWKVKHQVSVIFWREWMGEHAWPEERS